MDLRIGPRLRGFPPGFRLAAVTGGGEPCPGSEATDWGVVEGTGRTTGLLSWPQRRGSDVRIGEIAVVFQRVFLVEIPGDLEGPELSRMTLAAAPGNFLRLWVVVGSEVCVCVYAHVSTARARDMFEKYG